LLIAALLADGAALAQPLTDELVENLALMQGKAVDLLIAADIRRADALPAIRQAVQRHGGRIMFEAPQVGYLRARLAVESARAVIRLKEVARYRIDGSTVEEFTANPFRPPPTSQGVPAAVPLRKGKPTLDLRSLSADTPAVSSTATGAPAFREDHPAYDGRGVGIAVIEGVGEIEHPALRAAMTLDGTGMRKTTGVVAVTGYDVDEPIDGPVARRTLRMRGETFTRPRALEIDTDPAGRFRFDGRNVLAPAPGKFRAALVAIGGAGNYVPSDQRLLVLWRKGERRAWIDTAGNGDLSHSTPIGDFNATGDVGHLPAIAKPGSRSTEAGPDGGFVLVFDSASGLPVLYGCDHAHTTSVAGQAAGHTFGGGRASSSAPNAHIVYVTGESTGSMRVSRFIEGMIQGASRSDVDVMTSSTSAEDVEKTDSFVGYMASRVIEISRKQIFIASGNTWGITETVGSGGTSSAVAVVGGYVSRETARLLGGLDLPKADYVRTLSRGPGRLGLMKPDFVAPSTGITPTILRNAANYHAPGAWNLPRGYYQFDFSSSATPVAASVAAALISGARQEHLPHDATRIFWSLKAGARYLQDWPAHAQGAGLINLPESWRLLKLSSVLPEWRYSPRIEVSASIANRFVSSMGLPPRGGGLYEREGWRVGHTGKRTLRMKRTSGPAGSVTYRMRWLGNDGTFRILSPVSESVVLPLDRWIDIDIGIEAWTAGIHSANLVLTDPEGGFDVTWISAAIVAALQLEPANGFSVSESGEKSLMQVSPHFVNVPPRTQVLKVDAQSHGGSFTLSEAPPIQLHTTWLQNSSYAEDWYLTFSGSHAGSRLYPHPAHGVWEFIGRDSGPALEERLNVSLNRHTVRFTALAAELVEARKSRDAEHSMSLRLTLQNTMGSLTAARTHVAVGARSQIHVQGWSDGLQAAQQFFVLHGTATLRVSVRADDGKTPLRLYLYDGSPEGKQPEDDEYGFKLWEVPFEPVDHIDIRRPGAGAWRVLARAANDADWNGNYTVTIIAAREEFGTARVAGEPTARRHAEIWREDAQVQVNAAKLPAGATPVAFVEICDSGAEAAETNSLPLPGHFQRPVAVGSAILPL